MPLAGRAYVAVLLLSSLCFGHCQQLLFGSAQVSESEQGYSQSSALGPLTWMLRQFNGMNSEVLFTQVAPGFWAPIVQSQVPVDDYSSSQSMLQHVACSRYQQAMNDYAKISGRSFADGWTDAEQAGLSVVDEGSGDDAAAALKFRAAEQQTTGHAGAAHDVLSNVVVSRLVDWLEEAYSYAYGQDMMSSESLTGSVDTRHAGRAGGSSVDDEDQSEGSSDAADAGLEEWSLHQQEQPRFSYDEDIGSVYDRFEREASAALDDLELQVQAGQLPVRAAARSVELRGAVRSRSTPVTDDYYISPDYYYEDYDTTYVVDGGSAEEDDEEESEQEDVTLEDRLQWPSTGSTVYLVRQSGPGLVSHVTTEDASMLDWIAHTVVNRVVPQAQQAWPFSRTTILTWSDSDDATDEQVDRPSQVASHGEQEQEQSLLLVGSSDDMMFWMTDSSFLPQDLTPPAGTVSNDLPTRLMLPDGSVNWGLVYFALLLCATICMAVAFVVSAWQLLRTLRCERMQRNPLVVPFAMRRDEKGELVLSPIGLEDGYTFAGKPGFESNSPFTKVEEVFGKEGFEPALATECPTPSVGVEQVRADVEQGGTVAAWVRMERAADYAESSGNAFDLGHALRT